MNVKIRYKVQAMSLGDNLEGYSVGVQVALNLKLPRLP